MAKETLHVCCIRVSVCRYAGNIEEVQLTPSGAYYRAAQGQMGSRAALMFLDSTLIDHCILATTPDVNRTVIYP